MTENIKLLQEISTKTKVKLKENVLGKKLTTFSIGGPLNVFEVETIENLQNLLFEFNKESLSYKIIGAGSNLLVPDQGIESPVVKLGKQLNQLKKISDCEYEVAAARSLMRLSREMSQEGLSGLEFAGGIPASVGGAVRMNAGAHAGEMSEIISSVTYIDQTGEIYCKDKQEINFTYRTTSIPQNAVIVSCKLKLKKSDKEKTLSKQKENLEYRKSTQPLQMPSAGSIFRNPNPLKAGEIIEKQGLKGFSIGNAQVSELHANWIVNPTKMASNTEVIDLINYIKNLVMKEQNIELLPELVIWP